MSNFWGITVAIIRRDALIAFAYPLAFFARWVSLPVSLAGTFYVSHLVGGSAHFKYGHDYFTYVSVNLVFVALAGAALQAAANSVRLDQVFGTFEPLVAAQPNPLLIIAATQIWPLITGILQAAVALIIAILCFGLVVTQTNIVTLGVFLLLGTAAMSSIGLAAAAAVIAFKQMPPSGYLVGSAASLLAGAAFPISLLPRPVQYISWLLPLTHALNGLRAAVRGLPLSATASDAWWLLIATGLVLPASFLAVRIAISRSIADGTLAQY